MVLLGAGFTVMSKGTIGFVIGGLCVVAAIVWKVWATRAAARLMEERDARQHDPTPPDS